MNTYWAYYLLDRLGASPSAFGVIMGAGGVAGALLAPRIAARIGVGPTIIVGFAVSPLAQVPLLCAGPGPRQIVLAATLTVQLFWATASGTSQRSLTATADPAAALDGADFLVLSIPAQSLRANLASWAAHIGSDTVIVSLMKGIEQGSHLRASQIITEVAGVSAERVAVLSGPNLAREIMDGQPAAATIACPDEHAAHRFQRACRTGYFRPYTSTDVIGCELGGAVKNVIALAVGIASGMGLDDNATAMLITRGLAETARLAVAMGAHPATSQGLPASATWSLRAPPICREIALLDSISAEG